MYLHFIWLLREVLKSIHLITIRRYQNFTTVTVKIDMKFLYFLCRVGYKELWHLKFSHWCCCRFKSSGLWSCVVGQIVPDVLMDYSTFMLDPEDEFFKPSELLTQFYNITFLATWTFTQLLQNIPHNTSNKVLRSECCRSNTAVLDHLHITVYYFKYCSSC